MKNNSSSFFQPMRNNPFGVLVILALALLFAFLFSHSGKMFVYDNFLPGDIHLSSDVSKGLSFVVVFGLILFVIWLVSKD